MEYKLQGFDCRDLIANKGSPSYSGSTDLQRWEHWSRGCEDLVVLFSEKNHRNVGHLQPLRLEDAPAVAMVLLGGWSLQDATFAFGDQKPTKAVNTTNVTAPEL